MICYNCRENPLRGEPKRHSRCINDWGINPKANEGALIKRPEPLRICACQHKKSWQFVKSGDKREAEGSNGNGS
jgi:hypothetical protein